MNQSIKLKLPKKGRPSGLFLYCNSCKNCYSSDRDAKCKCGKLVYKARIHIAGTKYGYVSRVFSTSEFSEAVTMFYQLRDTLVQNSFQTVPIVKQESIPSKLTECFAWYMGYLNNVGIPKHKHKLRDPDHIRKVDLAFQLYLKALQQNGINTSILKFTEVSDEMVGFIHEYFLTDLQYANKTYNNRMALLRTFTSHIIKEFDFEYKNPFLGMPDLLVTPKVTAVREGEFNDLLKILTPEQGIEKRKQKGRVNLRTTTWYKPWLKHAFCLGLYTGGRSEDVVELKWSDVVLGADGKFDTLKTIDYKIDKAHSNKTSAKERIVKHFAITKELGNLLLDMGYDRYKGSHKYIIAPEDTLKRTNVARIISGAFTHYYKQLNTGREVTFRNLRKTYITSALSQFGVSSTALTNHKNISISDKHYHDKEVTREVAKTSFSVFLGKKTTF
jgi:integrase